MKKATFLITVTMMIVIFGCGGSTRNYGGNSSDTQLMLEDMIIKTIKALQNRDEAAINQLLHKDFGIVLLTRPGAHEVVIIRNKIAFSNPPPGFLFMPAGAPVVEYKVRFEELPVFDCDDAWEWNKLSGIYCQANDISKNFLSPSRIAKSLVEADLITLPAAEIKKLEQLESKSFHYTIAVIGKTTDQFDFLNFTFTLIDGKWYLTIINMVEPCA